MTTDSHSHSTGMSDNVRRQTIEDTRKRIMIYARISIHEFTKIQELKRIRGTNNESQIIREAINTYHGLLSGSKEIKPASNIIIQNPIVNMNINNNVAESKPQININIDLKILEDIVKLIEYLYEEASKNMPLKTRRVIERRVRQAERVLQDLMIKLN